MRLMLAIATTAAGFLIVPLLQGCASSQSSPAAQIPTSAPQAQAQPPTQPQAPAPPSATAQTKPSTNSGDGGEQSPSALASSPVNKQAEQPEQSSGTEGAGESPAAPPTGGGSNSPQPAGAATQGGLQPDGGHKGSDTGGARTGEEQTSGLDRKLDRSLEEFDGLLLDEQQRVAEASGAAHSGSSGSGGSGSRAPGQSGEGAPAAESNPRRESGASASGGSPDAPTGKPGEQQSGAAGATSSRESDQRPPIPSDVGDGGDDDVIARQLREAAMSEEDPDLREKLWQEYRDYKESLGGKARDRDE